MRLPLSSTRRRATQSVLLPSRNNSPRLKSPRRAASLIAMATKSGFCASLKSTTTIRSKLCRSLSDCVRRSMADLTTSTSKQPPSAKKTLPQAGQSGGASTIALVKSKSRPLRTLLAQTLLAQLASLFVVQYWAEFHIQVAVPVQRPVRYGLALSDSQIATPRPRIRSCQRPMSLMLVPRSCSSCSGVICENIAKASASFPG